MRAQGRLNSPGHESDFAKVSALRSDPEIVEILRARLERQHTIAPNYRKIAAAPSDTECYIRQQRTNEIAEKHGINRLTAEVLASRGVVPGVELTKYLEAKNRPMPFSSEIKGLSVAASIVEKDIRAGRLVAFVGDYDVDGVTALAQCVRVMKQIGSKFTAASPCRLTQGYGLSEDAVRDAHRNGASTLVCLDIGSSNHASIKLARSLGIKVVVIDHHLGEELNTLPANVLVNPHQRGCGFEDGKLCASALTHLWLRELASRFGIGDLNHLLPLAGFATIADVVPLEGLNRTITANALELTPKSTLPGVRALLELLKSKGINIETQDVSYLIAPILNAVGRMVENGAEIALKLLTTEDLDEARQLAEKCIAANTLRKKIETEMIEHVASEVTKFHSLPHIIVLASEKFHPGVVGLTAARAVERYGRPVILFSIKGDGTLIGSGRSLPGFHLKSLLDECSRVLLRYGGHSVAVGCTLKEEDFEDFKWRINFRAEDRGNLPPHEARFDRELSLRAYSKTQEEVIRDLKVLAPTGKDNEPASFLARNVSVVSAYQVGKRHTMLILREGKKRPTLVAGYLWHNPDHPAVISDSGEVSFSKRHPLRLPVVKGIKVNVVYRPMRLEGRDVVTGNTSAKVEIVAIERA